VVTILIAGGASVYVEDLEPRAYTNALIGMKVVFQMWLRSLLGC